MKNKKFMIILIIAFANLSFLAAQTESEPSDHFVLTYNLGAEYSYSLDFGLYDSIPFYDIWQKQMTDISPKMIDPLGDKGHVFRVVNH